MQSILQGPYQVSFKSTFCFSQFSALITKVEDLRITEDGTTKQGERTKQLQTTRPATILDETVDTVTQIHLHFYTPLLTLPFPLLSPLRQCCYVLSSVLQYISDQDQSTLSLGRGERAAFKWIHFWSTQHVSLSQQVLSKIVEVLLFNLVNVVS